MKATSLQLGVVVAGLLLTAAPVLAQRPEPGAGAADRGAGNGGGGAMSSGGGGGGGNIAASGGGGGSASSSSSGSGFSSPSVSSVSSPSISGGDRGFRASAPEHRLNFSDGGQRVRTAPSSDGGQSASPRASGGSAAASNSSGAPARSAPAGERATPRGAASSNTAGRANETTAPNNPNNTREVPSWARPRGDRPATDTAVNREGPRPPRSAGDRSRDGYGGYYYDPYYYGGFGYGFGLGLYDQGYYGYPFYSPFGFGYGIPYGFYDPFYGDPYDYGAGYGAYSSDVYGGHDQGSLRLKVKPRQAKVYVDGYYVGTIDDFDGAFQKLTLNGGRHKVELRADGYETTEFDVLITPQQTVTFAGDMKKNQ
jgi:hypothetical protein